MLHASWWSVGLFCLGLSLGALLPMIPRYWVYFGLCLSALGMMATQGPRSRWSGLVWLGVALFSFWKFLTLPSR